MSQLVSVQGQLYKKLCLHATPQSDDDSALIKTHHRASKANRPQYIIKRTCLTRLEELQPGEEPANPVTNDDAGSEPDTEPGTPLLNRTSKLDENKPDNDPEPLTLVQAVRKLDPTNDEHWTNAGLPAMEAVEALFGKNVSRGAVSDVAPGYDREAAAAAAE